MTTRALFAAWAGVAAVVAVVVAGLVALGAVQHSLDTAASARADAVFDEVSPTPESSIKELCRSIATKAGSLDIVVSLVSTTGVERCRSRRSAPSPRALGVGRDVEPPRTVDVAGVPWLVTYGAEASAGVVVVGQNVAAERRAEAEARRAVLVGMGLGTLLALVVGTVAALPATRRIRRLVERIDRAGRDRSGTARVGAIGGADLDEAAAAVDSLLDDLHAADAAQRRLLADAAHELRTPLTSIRTNAQLLERDPAVTGDARDIAERISRQGAAVSDLVSRLVDHAAVGAWTNRDAHLVRMGDLARRAADRVRERWPQVDIVVTSDDSVGKLDAELVVRAIVNILDNAIVHGNGRIDVRVESRSITVEDAGDGFPDSVAHDAFRPFRSGAGGTGLGLAFVEHVARAHGGGARIASARPARVEIWFPAEAAAPE